MFNEQFIKSIKKFGVFLLGYTFVFTLFSITFSYTFPFIVGFLVAFFIQPITAFIQHKQKLN